ncbi:phage baseplate assembly protein V [Verminephrobacter aporrectodeae subsp. tuberculatae]|uniref:Phage baseplate assembly protein V n=1 Tax=Verminephrobacter aporrectodeae subsp. tuberculatae TaxID=1110392 RepID=A0ABT3KMX3_9BURK|nr:phage baseplate assembly protein V [Verminephrobacter aporrectodeae]MCW5319630.1 phage baseplate assembly protein V [Verminephrobacter aporrectodeae subsp. tuberculatae]
MSFEQSETDRAMACMLMAGTIEAVQYKPPRVRVRSGDWVSSFLPWFSVAAGGVRHWRPPTVGEQAMVFSVSGQPEQGIVLAGLWTDQFPANDDRENITAMDWQDGARMEYDHEAHKLKMLLPPEGHAMLTIGGTTLEMKAGGVTLTNGTVKVVGGDVIADGVSLKQHKHTEQGDFAETSSAH